MQQRLRFITLIITAAASSFTEIFDLGVSQAEHPEVFEGVPSEGRRSAPGKKEPVLSSENRTYLDDPRTVFQSASKYAGYFLGKRYQKLPERLILFCTMSRNTGKTEMIRKNQRVTIF